MGCHVGPEVFPGDCQRVYGVLHTPPEPEGGHKGVALDRGQVPELEVLAVGIEEITFQGARNVLESD